MDWGGVNLGQLEMSPIIPPFSSERRAQKEKTHLSSSKTSRHVAKRIAKKAIDTKKVKFWLLLSCVFFKVSADGFYTELVYSGVDSEVEVGRWYKVSAVAVGSSLQLFVDNVKVLEIQDNSHFMRFLRASSVSRMYSLRANFASFNTM